MLGLFSSSDAALIVAALVTVCVPVIVGQIMTYRRAGDARDSAHETKAQMSNNGGSSLRDAVDRIELNQFRFEDKWDKRFASLERRTGRIEQAATDAATKVEGVATAAAVAAAHASHAAQQSSGPSVHADVVNIPTATVVNIATEGHS